MANPFVFDLRSENFETDVLTRSHDVLVLVDFWASWCGPCQMLTPVLERAALAFAGSFVVAKVNTDEEPSLAARFHIQGIPAVKAFRNGEQVGEFTGALRQDQVEAFVRSLMPSKADEFTEAGLTALGEGDRNTARGWLERALKEDARHPGALVSLGQIFYENGQLDEGEKLFQQVTRGGEDGKRAEKFLAWIDLSRAVSGLDELNILEAIASANADNLQARLDLGVRYVFAGDMEMGLENLLVAAESGLQAEEARHRMIQAFTILGASDSVTRKYRERLADILL